MCHSCVRVLSVNIVFETLVSLASNHIVFGRQENRILSCSPYYRANSLFPLHFPPCFRVHDRNYWSSPQRQGRGLHHWMIVITKAYPSRLGTSLLFEPALFSLFFYLISSAGPISCSNNEIWRGENSAPEVQALFLQITRAQCAEDDTIEHELRCCQPVVYLCLHCCLVSSCIRFIKLMLCLSFWTPQACTI